MATGSDQREGGTEAVRDVLDRAAELPPGHRPAFLDDACGSDAALRAEVESLLAALDEAGGLLADPTAAAADHPAAAEIRPHERPGVRVGRYRLMEQIGEGGFGVVFMAEQERPVRRRVAVKVLKAGMDTRQVVARFEAERQALALMDHENIARVFDGGTTATGRPYFVMELVRGSPITDYCDRHNLTPRERLSLFAQVCHAVQHAHTKGVIHRDLKPSNVLVTVADDGRPVPKVIDFGIAKATAAGQRLTDRTLFTEFRQLIGTPAYMSPEQAEADGIADVDTRTDVYALGVLLYELLTGSTPLEKDRLLRAAHDEVRRIIREEEPPRPSTRLSTLAGERLAEVAARRGAEPRRLGQLVRGELDWIVMRAMEKDRRRRYETADGLGRDVERYLTGDPVEACPPSRVYRLRTFARRNRAGLATAAVIAVVLLVATVMSTSQAVRATRAEVAVARQRDEILAAKRAADDQQRVTQLHLYASRINLAQQAWEAAEVAEADHLLDLLQPGLGLEDLRGFEWHYLKALCAGETRPLPKLPGAVTGLAVSPDGRTLVTGAGRLVRTWDAVTWRLVAELPEAPGEVRAVAFSPDGATLAVAAGDAGEAGRVLFWDVPGGRPRREPWVVPEGTVLAIAFRPDGAGLLAGTATLRPRVGTPAHRILTIDPHQASSGVWLLDVSGGSRPKPFPGDPRAVLSVAFSPDGRNVAAGTWDGAVTVWDADARRPKATTPKVPGHVWCVAFSPDGRLLATGSGDWQGLPDLRLWAAGALQGGGHTLVGHRAGVTSVAFSPDGQTLASAGFDKTVRVWDVAARRELNVVRGHRNFVAAVAFVPGGGLVSGDWDGTVRSWDAGRTPGETVLTGAPPYSGDFAPDGATFAAAGGENAALIDVASGRVRLTLPHPGGDVIARYSPDGGMLVTAGMDRVARLWHAGTGELRHELHGHPGKIWAAAFSADSRLVATGGWPTENYLEAKRRGPLTAEHGTTKIWDARDGTLVREVRPAGRWVRGVAFGPGDRTLITGTENPRGVSVWDLASGERLAHEAAGAGAIAFTRDGRTMVTTDETRLHIWDTGSWRIRRTVRAHTSSTWDVDIAPDDRTIATAGWDGTVKLWNVATGDALLTLHPRGGVAWSVRFAPDGQSLWAGSGPANEVRRWHVTTRPTAGGQAPARDSRAIRQKFYGDQSLEAARGYGDLTNVLVRYCKLDEAEHVQRRR